MIRPGGFILMVDPGRAETLLDHATPGQAVGEPVDRFNHSKRAPLLVLCSFERGAITHIAEGRKGVASGTQMVRLNLIGLQELVFPLRYTELLQGLSPQAKRSVERRLREGGMLPPKAFQAVLDVLLEKAPDLADRLAGFSERRSDAISALSRSARQALAGQKESVGLALKIAGLNTRELLAWSPGKVEEHRSFLDGLPGARVREDAMVVHDLGTVPGFEAVRDYPFAAKVFERDGARLTVILANKLPLEEQFGTDLIYYNERFEAFIMVQYKVMERETNGKSVYRLPNKQLDAEIARMDATAQHLERLADNQACDSFRLSSDPFVLKLCARYTFNPDDAGLFPGMYLPLSYWRRLVAEPATLGPRGGRHVSFENVRRRLTESEFIALVAGGWIGTHAVQSQYLEKLVREVLESGKSLVLAVRSGEASIGWYR